MDVRKTPVGFAFVLVLAFAACRLDGQTPVSAGWGGIGDPAEAPGDPASSYALDTVDHVNFYSGSVNVAIPVTVFGGRGTVSKTIAIPIQRQWSVYANAPSSQMWNYIGGRYTSGFITFSTSSPNPTSCLNTTNHAYYGSKATSYITWNGYDGSQTVLVDTTFYGEPEDPNGSCQPADRGTVFRSTDGSGLMFVANADVHDGDGSVSGKLITRDGTKYSFSSDSYVNQIEDRNGNLIQFSFSSTPSGGIYTVTDPLNRQPTVNFTEDLVHDDKDVITYPGFNGASRTVTVNYALLANALTSGESPQTYKALFPELSGSSTTQFNPYVISSVALADGTSYSMLYNSYGDLTRLTLPTGGYIQYQYSEAYAGGSSGAILLADGTYKIQRHLLERGEYSHTAALLGKMVYLLPSSGTYNGRPYVLATGKFEDANGNILRGENHYFYGNPYSATAPPADNTYADWWEGLEYETDITDGGTTVFEATARLYQQRPWAAGENPWFVITADAAPLHDPQLCQANTAVGSATAGAVYVFDQYNNATDQYQSAFGSAPAIGSACPSSMSPYLQHTNTSYLVSNARGTYTGASTNLVSLPSEVKVWDGAGNLTSDTKLGYDEPQYGLANCPNLVGHDNANFAGGGTRGNLTSVQQYLNTSNSWITTDGREYDIAGNLVGEIDGDGHTTTFSHNDSYADGNNGRNTYAFLTWLQNAQGQTTFTSNYDYGSGQPYEGTDITGNYWLNGYGSAGMATDRLVETTRGYNTNNAAQTSYSYAAATDRLTYQDQTAAGDKALAVEEWWDDFGRPTVSKAYEGAGGYIETDTSYDALGRVASVSNPYRPGETAAYTTYVYDPLGRATSVQSPDGLTATTKYSGNAVTATDQAGKARTLVSDALGRLTDVYEDPSGNNFHTNYAYANNVVTVTQGGETRSFVSDTLGRLKSAVNPESGTVGYTYDSAGNLLTRTDARGIVTTYGGYDALNRPTTITYSDGTPAVTLGYDAVANSTGQLTSISNSNSATTYTAFDALGRVTASSQQVNGLTYGFTYTYNLAGALTSETYPSGRVVTTGYDAANRSYSLSGNLNGLGTNYITQTAYLSNGGISSLARGNTLWYLEGYNNRLQLTSAEHVGGGWRIDVGAELWL